MADRFEFTLGSVEASVLGPALDVDVRRFPLRIRNSTVDPARFAKLAQLVHADLEQRRLSVAGRLHPSVRTAFELFASSRVAVSITGIDGIGADITVLTLTDGAQALGITQPAGEDTLHFALFSDDELVEVLAGVLPVASAAPSGALTVEHRPGPARSAMAARRQAEAEYDEEETDAFGNIQVGRVVQPSRAPRKRGTHSHQSDADALARIMAGERLGGGHIAATGRGRVPPLGWLDTAQGRYLVQTTTGEDGTLVARYVPASTADVANAIQGVISSVY